MKAARPTQQRRLALSLAPSTQTAARNRRTTREAGPTPVTPNTTTSKVTRYDNHESRHHPSKMKFFHTFVLWMVGPVLGSDSDVVRDRGSPNAASNEYFLRLGGRPLVSVAPEDFEVAFEVAAVVPLPVETLLAVALSDDFARSSEGRPTGNADSVRPIVVGSGFDADLVGGLIELVSGRASGGATTSGRTLLSSRIAL